MNEVSGITTQKPINTQVKKTYNGVNFKASKAENPADTFEKQRKKAQREKNLSLALQVGMFGLFAVIAGIAVYPFLVKGGGKTVFEKISDKMPSLNDDCVNPKVKDFIQKTVGILKTPKDLLEYTGAENPRMVLFHGPTGTGKTFAAKLLAKEMGAEYGEIQFSDLSSEYIGKTAVNISQKFKQLAEMAKKNPDKQYVVAFNEIDSLINNVEKLGSNNMHLGQNRTSFLNGLDSIKDIPNLTIVGTTNINPNSANLDQATLSRLGNIFEIKRPTAKEIVASLKFHLGKKSKATGDLIKNDAELQKLAEQIEAKAGAQRDVEFLVKDSLLDFTRDIEGKADAKSTQMTADYIEKAINKKETWAAGIETGTTPTGSIPQVPNSLMDEFWKFIARRKGAM